MPLANAITIPAFRPREPRDEQDWDQIKIAKSISAGVTTIHRADDDDQDQPRRGERNFRPLLEPLDGAAEHTRGFHYGAAKSFFNGKLQFFGHSWTPNTFHATVHDSIIRIFVNPETTSKSQSVRAVFRNGQFTRYMTGETISMTGTWMQMMAQAWVMTTLTDRAVMLGMVTFASSIPIVALSLIGGSFADRHDKRAILLVTQVVQIGFAILVGRLVATGQIHIWHILVVAFFLGISTAFEMPSAAALVPELVGKENIAAAIAVDRSVFHGTRLIGPALAGYVIGIFGPAAAFYANALSFVALIIALCTIHPRAKGSAHEEEQRRGSMMDGFRYVRSDKPTLAMITLLVATVLFVFPVMMVMMPLYAKDVLFLGPGKMGLLMGISGIGSLTGSISLLGVRKENRRKLLYRRHRLRGRGADQHVAGAPVPRRRRFRDHALARRFHTGRPDQYHHPGTRPRPDARPRLGHRRDELLRPDAVFRPRHHEHRRLARHPPRAADLRRLLPRHRHLRPERPRPPPARTARQSRWRMRQVTTWPACLWKVEIDQINGRKSLFLLASQVDFNLDLSSVWRIMCPHDCEQ